MFVLSVKAKKKNIFLILAAILLAVTLIITAVKLFGGKGEAAASASDISLAAATNEDRVAFLKQFGWECNTEPVEIRDVTIPLSFSDVFSNYNDIQKAQGMDLLPLAGKTCRQWVYELTNYPDTGTVRATLLVYNDQVVGGDISSAELNGFMCGFRGEHVDSPESQAEESSSSAEGQGGASQAASSEIPANAWPTD